MSQSSWQFPLSAEQEEYHEQRVLEVEDSVISAAEDTIQESQSTDPRREVCRRLRGGKLQPETGFHEVDLEAEAELRRELDPRDPVDRAIILSFYGGRERELVERHIDGMYNNLANAA